MISGSNTRRRGELTSIASLASRNRWVAMTKRRRQGYFQVVLVGALLNSVLLSVGYAQVTTNITSSGLGTTVSQAGTTWNITGGTPKGGNLFHSFGSLNIGAGNTANFCNAATCGAAP